MSTARSPHPDSLYCVYNVVLVEKFDPIGQLATAALPTMRLICGLKILAEYLNIVSDGEISDDLKPKNELKKKNFNDTFFLCNITPGEKQMIYYHHAPVTHTYT